LKLRTMMSIETTTITKTEDSASPIEPNSGSLKSTKQISKTDYVPSLEVSDDGSVTSASSSVNLLQSSFLHSSRTPNHHDYSYIDEKKTVTFSPMLVIRSHKITIGDSLSCPILPLTLDWEHAEPSFLDMDRYESSPATRRRRRRGPRKLMFFERNELLQYVSGYTPAELYKAKKEGLEAQKRDQEQFKQVLSACD
jgi:hypothetical protein